MHGSSEVLELFLEEILGLDTATATDEAAQMARVLSEETLERFESFIEYARERGIDEFRRGDFF